MENLKKLLGNPFDGLKKADVDGFVDKSKKIAKDLLCNYCIKCGNEKYNFAEIEFYYYETDRWEEPWNEKTYPRKGKDAGDFFFHYSGFDLCFNSNYGEDKAKYGGILIRSLKNGEGKFITGPSVCSLEILNTCMKEKSLPELTHDKNKECKFCEDSIERRGITYKDNQEDKKLCFYDECLKENLKNTFESATWDYGKKNEKKIVRDYSKRFAK